MMQIRTKQTVYLTLNTCLHVRDWVRSPIQSCQFFALSLSSNDNSVCKIGYMHN